MPSRLTFGVEFEFALALLGERQGDPEPQLSQPATPAPTSSNPTFYKRFDEILNAVFELISTAMVASGLPTRPMKRAISPDNSPNESVGGQDDGVGWIPSRQRRPGWITPLRRTDQGVELQRTEQEVELQRTDQEVEHAQPDEDLIDFHSEVRIPMFSEFGNQWMVTEDVSISPTRSHAYQWYAIEVQSPPYIFCEDSLQAVKLACDVITRNFRVETNRSTGLHVHVGDGADGYTLQTTKKLMAFLWTFEPQFDQLHPNRRARLSDGEAITWYESLRRGSNLCERRSFDGSFPIKVLDGLKMIFNARNMMDLDRLVSPDNSKSAYKISQLTYDGSMKRTVEFRQHEGSMDGTRTAEWIRTVVGLVEWIMDVDTTTLMDFLQQAADFEDRCWPEEDQPPYDIIDLLNDVGLVQQAAYWDRAVPEAHRNPPTKYYLRPREPQYARRPSQPDPAQPDPWGDGGGDDDDDDDDDDDGYGDFGNGSGDGGDNGGGNDDGNDIDNGDGDDDDKAITWRMMRTHDNLVDKEW